MARSYDGALRLAAVLVIVGVALRLVLLIWAEGTMIDDAYITARYSRNLVNGLGLVYNSGERVLGVTTPLYAVWVALLLLVTPASRIGYAVGIANIAAFALTALALLRLSPETGRRAVLVAVLLFALYMPFVDNSVVGMETPFFLLGMMVSLVLLVKDRVAWASLICGALILVRPEGVLWVLSMLAALAVTRRRPRPRELLPGVLVVLLWAVFAVSYYGSPIPQSLSAKCEWVVPLARRSMVVRAAWTFASLALVEVPARLQHLPAARLASWIASGGSFVLFILGARDLLRRRSPLVALPVLFVLYVVSYVGLKARCDFSWYGIPSGLAYAVTVSIGLAWLARRLVSPRVRRTLFGLCVSILAVLLLGSSIVGWRAVRLPYFRLLRGSYAKAAEVVDGQAGPGARILVDETGMIGWRMDRHVYELSGIITTEVLEHVARGDWEEPISGAMKEFEPEFVILHGENLAVLRRDGDTAWVDARYEVVARFAWHTVLRRRVSGRRPPAPPREDGRLSRDGTSAVLPP